MTTTDLVFVTAVSVMLMHEMDAVDKKEWRLLYLLRHQPDGRAFPWFVALHLPLLVGLLTLVGLAADGGWQVWQGAVDGFLIVHAGLHERFISKGSPSFATSFSRWLIWGAAGLATIHLLLMVS